VTSHLFFQLLSRVFFFFYFQKLDYDVPEHGYLLINTVWSLGSFLNLRFISSVKFEKFLAIISSNIFSPPPISPFLFWTKIA
jgi:hypothetical protein